MAGAGGTAGGSRPYAYFPLAIGLADGPAEVELLATGNEGLLGLGAFSATRNRE